MFSGGIKWKHWSDMGKEKFFKLKNSLFISYRFSNKLLTLFTDRFDLIIYWRKIMTFRTLVLSKLVAIQNKYLPPSFSHFVDQKSFKPEYPSPI